MVIEYDRIHDLCDDCGLGISSQRSLTDVERYLARLPAELFDRTIRAFETLEWRFNDRNVLDTNLLAPAGPDADATVVQAIAEVVADLHAIARGQVEYARALTLGAAPAVDPSTGRYVTPCDHASGGQLDDLAANYGVARPLGFSDCCLWVLVQLLVWRRPDYSSLAHVKALVELYTGHKVSITEGRALIVIEPASITGQVGYWNRNDYYDQTFAWGAVSAPAPPASFYNRAEHYAHMGRSVFRVGLTLEDAIAVIKAPGVKVQFVNMPPRGSSGCWSKLLRGPQGAQQFYS